MNRDHNTGRKKGKALKFAFAVLAAILALSLSMLFMVRSGGASVAGDSGPGGGVQLGANPAAKAMGDASLARESNGAVTLRSPDTGKEKAVGSTLADGQPASIRWDSDTGVPDFVTGQITPPPRANAQQTTLAFFDVNKGLYHMSDPKAELTLERQSTDALGMTHVHVAQTYQGVPVFGSDLAVHLSAQGKIVAVNGRYVPGIDLSVKPDVSPDQAVATAQHDLGLPVPSSPMEPPHLVVLTPGGRQAQLTWDVTLAGHNPEVRMVYFIDAHTGAIASRYNNLESAENRMTYTAGYGTALPGALLISEGGSSSDSVAQMTHDNTGVTYNYYYNNYHRDSVDNAGMTLTSSVHYSVNYNNAFWNGYQMVYGDGDGSVFSPLGGAIDVVTHELTHGVTQYTAGLIYSDQTGALNESCSDVLGELAETNPDWLIGEAVYTPSIPGDALRSMANPTLYGQPDNMANYVYTTSDNGGVHTNSGIPNKAAYNIAMAIGKDKMGQIWYRALTLYMTSSSQFSDARDACVQAATDLYGAGGAEVAAVENGFAAVGIGSGQTSTMTAHVQISHTYIGDLVVTAGVGDPNAPTWSTVVSNRQGGSGQSINTNVDISAAAAMLPPSAQNRWFLKVYDAAAQDVGTIQGFSITDNGNTYTATDVPIPINDFQTSISYVPSVDNTPPQVNFTSPGSGQTGVYGSARVTATFSEAVAPQTLGSSSFTLVKDATGTPVNGQISYADASHTATFTPAADLDPNSVYDATITTAVTDLAGNPLPQNYIWSFTTGPPPKPYYFTWYDMASPGMSDWVVTGNPSSSTSPAGFDVSIAGNKVNSDPVMTQPGQTRPVTYAGIIGGPVKVSSLGGTPEVVSQRTLLGDSFEEINGLDASQLDSHYYFTWYDAQSPGSMDWIMIANPGAATVSADIYIAGQKMNQSPYQITAGGTITPQFPGVIGGPVEVKAYAPGNPASPQPVIASQRVTWSGNFNEVMGIPAAQLTNDYLYTWYDMQSAGKSDWMLVSNPNASAMVAEIWIGGQKMTDSASGNQYFTVPAGGTVYPTFPGKMSGPVEVRGYDAASYNPVSPGSPNLNFYTTQRILIGSSFEELSGYGTSRLAPDYHFSWYDEQSAGSLNWVMVSNPGSSEVKAEVWIAGTRMTTLTIPPGASQTPNFPGIINGPVEVRGYDSATYNLSNPGAPNRNVFTSQRVLWNGHFNEVEGAVLAP